MKRFFSVFLLAASAPFAQQPAPSIALAVSSPSFHGGPAINALIEEAIRTEQIPGAVVLVGHKGQIVFHRAYGYRAVVPRQEEMTLDTIFDCASLTKVVATTSAMMKLVETGKVRLNDRVTTYIPEFQGGDSEITVRQLMTHYSGMRPGVDLAPEWSGYEAGIHQAVIDKPTVPPNTRFTYSDINFILLGEIVARASGKPLPVFVNEQVFAPLGMTDTMFTPSVGLRPRIAPTEIAKPGEAPLRGVVHDPTTRHMNGVAGHAGLFSTASDLAKFADMMLNMGERNGVRIFSPLTVRAFTSPASPMELPDIRGLGWDIDSRFSGNRGDLFPVGSFGHTGFTGTSLWIDPTTESYVILLANSVHPKLRPAITPLRGKLASVVAAGLAVDASSLPSIVISQRLLMKPKALPRNSEVLTGLDVLALEGFESLRGKRVGLITNHTGVTRDGRRNIDAMLAAGVQLKAIYSPEHGIAGKEDHENIGHGKDDVSGLPVWSLYAGQNRRPSEEMLRDIDVLVFDIQDIGTRFYTYVCTMKNAMEEAARRNVQFVVLDRPNPITGEHVEGPVLDPGLESFVGCVAMPTRHGMTLGELAQMMNADLQPKVALRVVRMKGWGRSDWFDSTGLTWIDPSPNMRSLHAALLYPGIGMLEYGKVYSVGRGTDAPFEQVGADWMRGAELAGYLNARAIPGIRIYPTRLRPTASNFAGQTVDGVRFVITDRDAFSSVQFGTELAVAMAKLYPGKMQWDLNEKLVGSKAVLKGLAEGQEPRAIERRYEAALEEFRNKRRQFLLY